MNTAVHQDIHHQTQINGDVAAGDVARESAENPSPHIPFDENQHHFHSYNGFGGSIETEFIDSASYDQLLLSFQGEIYVFDAVSPQKVQAVLLLLGGGQVPDAAPTVSVAPQTQTPQASDDFPGRLNQPRRTDNPKRTRYSVRQKVSRRMQHNKKGRFISSKSKSDDTSSSEDGNEISRKKRQETLCRACGISSKYTPQMRCGPAGPGSLCNACGLAWANKGILRDLSKIPTSGAQDQTAKSGEQSNVNGSDAMAAAAIITSDGDNPVVVAERMQCKKGSFISSKSVFDEAGPSSADRNKGSGRVVQETSCTHCGISSKSTPKMRAGPAGQGSLCNACGLMWTTKGFLRDLSKVPTPGAQDQTAKSEQSNGNASGAMAAAAIIPPDGDNPVLVAERVLRKLQSLLMTITGPNFAEVFSSHAVSCDQNSITSQDLPKNDSVL